MNQDQSASRKQLARGTPISGKWTGVTWTVHKCLGVGANGTVYSVRERNGQSFALKICDESSAAAFEWGVLETLAKCTDAFPQPHVIDDSAEPQGMYFYVMEQVEGSPLNDIWPRLTANEIVEILTNILRGLRDLHQAGHAFCDIKGQNILVSSVRGRRNVRFVDVGGVTPFGRSIRQYTPTSDCAFFGYGTRRASESYDLSALALMMVHLEVTVPKDLNTWSLLKRQDWLRKSIRKMQSPGLAQMVDDVLQGRITSASQWMNALLHYNFTQPVTAHKNANTKGRTAGSQASRTGAMRGAVGKQASKATPVSRASTPSDWSERVMWVSLVCAMVSTAGAWAVYLGVL